LREHDGVRQRLPELEKAVMAGRLTAVAAASELLSIFTGARA